MPSPKPGVHNPANPGAAAALAVELSLVIHAQRATVFRFFSDPARFARWWNCPGGGPASINPVAGGDVRINYTGGHAVMAGKVVELVPDERFVMTWGYEKGNDAVPAGSSRVEITLRDHHEGTLLTLRHTGLPTPEQCTGHEAGWRHYLAVVSVECRRDQFAGATERVVADWFVAWTSADPQARLAALQRRVTPDVEFRDSFSAVKGDAVLSAHIGNLLRRASGVELKLSGTPQQQHGYVRFGWVMAGPGGAQFGAGENFGRLAPDGRLASVVGFWSPPTK